MQTINRSLRLLAIIVLSTWLTVVASAAEPLAHADGDRTALFGTVISTPVDGNLEVVTRDGVIVLIISETTRIDDRKKKKLSLDEVEPGNSVTGYYTTNDADLIAGKLTFVDNAKRRNYVDFRHVVGVVVDVSGDKLTVLTDDGEQVDITVTDDPTNDPVTQGSLIATVVEENSDTGELDALALRTAQETVERLSAAISHEISRAQQKLLKIRMSETASVHLTRLYETLDQIEADAQAKIEAAFAEYETNYTLTFDENLIAPPLVQISGEILAINPSSMTIAMINGRKSYITVPADVEVILLGGVSGAMADLHDGDHVDVSATPQTSTESPIARLIQVIPDPSPPIVDEGDEVEVENENDDTITGTIVLVDAGNSGDQTVIIIDDPNGSDTTTVITDDTVVTGDDELVPGQEVEITLGEDGFSAGEIEVVNAPEPPATPVATQGPPIEYSIAGVIRSFSGNTVVLDDVYLTLDSITTANTPMTVGEVIQFKVIVDEAGRWVIVGVEQ
jgi:hypothetical protein